MAEPTQADGYPMVPCEGSGWEPNSAGLCRTCGSHWFALAGKADEVLPEHLRIDILAVAGRRTR